MIHLSFIKNGNFSHSDFWFVPNGFKYKHYDIKLGKITVAQCIVLEDGKVIGSKNVSRWRGFYKSVHHFVKVIYRKTEQHESFTYSIERITKYW